MSIAKKLTQIAENEQKVCDAGKEAERERFWEVLQDGGNATWYAYFFAYKWTDEIYRPKYPVTGYLVSAYFYTQITDTKVPIVSGAQSANQLFDRAFYLTTVPSLDLTLATSVVNAFRYCYALENITFVGHIYLSLDLQWSTKLSRASIENIMETLDEGIGGLSLTLSKAAVDNAFETAAGAADGSTSQAWTELVGNRLNWTVSLV